MKNAFRIAFLVAMVSLVSGRDARAQAVCGDDACAPGEEDCGTCPQDCPCPSGTSCVNRQCQENGPSCGDGACAPGAEDCGTCPQDCACPSGTSCVNRQCQANGPTCGDGTCTAGAEDCGTCPQDCPCPSGSACVNRQCQIQPSCGDHTCNPGTEDCGTCPQDCPCAPGTSCVNRQCQANPPSCGDHVCTAGAEDCGTCPQDCPCAAGTACVNRQCQAQAVCGDGTCTSGLEDCGTCPADCPCAAGNGCFNRQCLALPSCGDHVCQPGSEDCGVCPGDCPCQGGTSCVNRQCQAPDPRCGDGICAPGVEDCASCGQDCPCASGTGCQNHECAGPQCGNLSCAQGCALRPTLTISKSTPNANEEITLTATPDFIDDPSPKWDLGNGVHLEGSVVHYRYPAAGTYPIVLTATDARCHTSQLSDPVVVNVSPCGDRFCDDAEMGRCTLDCGICERVGPCTPDACPPLTCTPLDDYAVVQAGLPTLLRCGGFAFARVTLKNLGSTDWTRQQGYALVSTTDDAVTHAMRVDVPADVTVHPQDTYVFEFPLLTPSSGSGVAHTTWRMTNAYAPFGPAMAQDITYSQDNCGPGGLPPGGGVTSSSVIPVILDDGSGVYVYDISKLGDKVPGLVLRADRSTKTDCTQNPAKGLIRGTSLGLNTSSPGDIVVVSDNYVAWFDTTKNDGGPQPGGRLAQDTWRGGQLAGFWTLSGGDFKNKKPVPNCEGWAHNELIPGSASAHGETYFWDKFGPGIEQCLNVGCDTPTCHGTFFCFRYAQKGGTWRILTAPTSEDGGIRFKFGGRMTNDEGSSAVVPDGTFVDSAVEYLCRPDGIVMSWKFAASSTITTSNLFVYGWTGYGQDMDDTCCDEDPATNTYPDSVSGMATFYTSSRDHSVGELVLDTKCNGQSKPAFACTSADEQQRKNKDSIPLQSPQIGEWLASGEARQLPASGQTWTLQNKSQPGTGDGNQGNPERVAWDRFFSWNENAHDGTLGFGAARGPQKNTTLLKDRWYGTDLLLSTNGPNSVAVTSTGACAGSDCTVSFTATPRRPDVRTMMWSGCMVASGTAVSCVRATPGDVTARVDMTDGDGIAASAAGTRTAYASGFSVGTWGPCTGTTTCTGTGPTGCQTTGTQTRTVSSSGLTLDPDAAATPPAASQACTATGPGYVASYNSTYDANWTCTAAGANGCSKNRLSYSVASFGPNAPDAPLPSSVIYTTGYAAAYTATYEASWTCTGSGPNGCRKNRLSYSALSFSPTGPDAPVPAPAIYTTGYAATYTATYEASWTCTASGANGCRKNRLSYSGATFTPTGPDAPPPAAAIYTTGYIASYTSTYDTNWTCTATGATGCRKNRLSYSPSSYNATGPDASVPAAVIYTFGYVASYYVGPWSGCSASCGGGWQTRQVYANAWKAASPDAARPADTQGCNSNPCRLSCYDYGLYPTWGECYADGWAYCDTRYKDDGIGGLLTCRHGYN